MGLRIRGALGDKDPLNKVPLKRARSRVQKGPLLGVSLVLPRKKAHAVGFMVLVQAVVVVDVPAASAVLVVVLDLAPKPYTLNPKPCILLRCVLMVVVVMRILASLAQVWLRLVYREDLITAGSRNDTKLFLQKTSTS